MHQEPALPDPGQGDDPARRSAEPEDPVQDERGFGAGAGFAGAGLLCSGCLAGAGCCLAAARLAWLALRCLIGVTVAGVVGLVMAGISLSRSAAPARGAGVCVVLM